MMGEEEARQRREARRRELIERLNAEERHSTREELEEREHQAELEESTRKHPWLYLALYSASLLGLGSLVSLLTRHYSGLSLWLWWLPLVLGLWVGASLTHFAFRYLTWPSSNSKLIRVASLAGAGFLLLAQLPILPFIGPDTSVALTASLGLLLGVACIARLRAGYPPYS